MPTPIPNEMRRPFRLGNLTVPFTLSERAALYQIVSSKQLAYADDNEPMPNDLRRMRDAIEMTATNAHVNIEAPLCAFRALRDAILELDATPFLSGLLGKIDTPSANDTTTIELTDASHAALCAVLAENGHIVDPNAPVELRIELASMTADYYLLLLGAARDKDAHRNDIALDDAFEALRDAIEYRNDK